MASRPGIEWSASATPWIAALAVLCSSTALAGVIEGGLWLVHIAVAIAVVTGTGALLRSTRLPAPVVGLGQLLALLCLLVTIFTRTGFLFLLPGPTSLGDLLTVLGDSIGQVQTGVPPVEATAAIRCLVMVAIGLVTILVDTLAVAAAAPAASGLVLLCVFAVPASLAEEMLPFWTFIFGAAAFALLLAVDGQHRHEAWRGRLGTGASSGSGSSATAVAAIAMVIALVVGAGFTLVGTIGRLPGSGNGIGGSGSSGLGIKAMTNLRGMLNQGRTRELFHVRGLQTDTYLRATTLDRYVPNSGWERGGDPSGRPVQGELPRPPGDRGEGKTSRVDIDPVGWRDFWLPVYGSPRRLDTPDDDYLYDPDRGIVFAQNQRKPEPYQLETVLDVPTADQLRRAVGDVPIDRSYFAADGVEEPVAQLARDITKDATNQFDKAAKLYEHFTNPVHGFKYKLETKGDLTSDALSDFLFRGKVGYCEQYASAMAVMARKIGIPARVALGFTAGYVDGDRRVITSEDAHAWVEIFFPGHGWVTFDPTPMDDGRAVVPPYLRNTSPTDEPIPSGSSSATTTTAPTSTSTTAGATENNQAGTDQGAAETPIPAWHFWSLGGVLLMAVLLTLLMVLRAGMAGAPWARKLLLPITVALWALAVALSAALLSWLLALVLVVVGLAVAPLTIRAVRRHNRLHTVAGLGPQAAAAAWEELMAESIDRGVLTPTAETVRAASRRLAREHNLDDAGRDGLRTLISSIERSWYSARPEADPALPAAVEAVRASLARNAPLSLRARILPRSVLHPVPRPTVDAPAPIPV
ncbi:transglutaminase domain-containing protein [Lentzea tibetensis]|uniref:Transglutaminase domain-containing protein n=1 Tax=Lentzea tibetensis TaxID=2591470 RepID=A0A563ERM4_9PSEU|nr:DUF3488 and transglutaminase-like domain-containing protein [Lentzea tibetensis]TWP50242.1 transglutaminase domain-containing protein [Lentzea tibetensis]